MQRAYRFRLYPTQEQDDLLNVLRYQSCVLYNEALDVRKKAYRTKGQTLNFVSLWSRFKADRKERPEDFGLLNATQVRPYSAIGTLVCSKLWSVTRLKVLVASL